MRLLLVLLLLIPNVLLAQPISIRSGEHETFSRLVLSINDAPSWNLTEIENGFALQVEQHSGGFDTSEVFERLPRNRIRSLTQSPPDRLTLELNCDCVADMFLWRPGQLVLDIIDVAAVNPSAENSAEQIPDPTSVAQVLPNLLTLELAPSAPMGPLVSLVSEPASPEVQETEAALLQSLSRAASQGFLDAAVQPVSDVTERQTENQNETIIEEQPPEIGLPDNNQPGVGFSTATDRDIALLRDILGARAEPRCLPDDMFALADWANDDAYHDQVSSLAEALAGEFGEEPLDAQDQLARLHVHFGFGVEARTILGADDAQSLSRSVLFELAGLIDEYDEDFPILTAQSNCETAGAFWSFLALPMPLTDEQNSRVIQTFFLLPQPLRGHLAPRLSKNYISIGNPSSAEMVLRASQSNDVEGTHSVQATRALIAEAVDDPGHALTLLQLEAENSARTSPESLINLVRLHVENGTVPTVHDLVLMEAMRQEYQGTPVAQALQIAEAEGHILTGEYSRAIGLVQDIQDPLAMRVLNKAFSNLTKNGSTADFLTLGFADLPDSLDQITENQVAARMLALGFPERAIQITDAPASREAAAERRYLRAQGYLELNNYTSAIDAVSGLTDPRAQEILAGAYSGLGDHNAALQAVGAVPVLSDEILQFRAGAWDRLTTEGGDALSNFAQSRVASPVINDGGLAARRDILVQSEESRRAIDALLSRFSAE